MTFMIAFIPLSLPVAWVIDTRGFRLPVGIGAVLMGIFGVAARPGRRELHAGLVEHDRHRRRPAVPAQLLDQGAGQLVRRQRTRHRRRSGDARQHVGIAARHGADADPGRDACPSRPCSSSTAACGPVGGPVPLLARERPATPPCPAGQEVRALMLDGLKHALKVKTFWLIPGRCLRRHGHFQRRHHLGREHHPAARLHADGCRDVGSPDAGRRGDRRGRALGLLGQAAQASPLPAHRPRAGHPGPARLRLRHLAWLLFAFRLHPGLLPRRRAADRACSTPPRSPSPHPRARPTA